MKLYKLTNQDGQTHGGCQWGEGVTHTASGKGGLCGPGWLHAYTDPLLAVFLNPIHANIQNPRLWECDGEVGKTDHGLKIGCTRLTTIREIPLPAVTTNQRVRFAILCAKTQHHDAGWTAWADGWLSNANRAAARAYSAAASAYSAAASAYSAADSAAASAAGAARAAYSAATAAASAASAYSAAASAYSAAASAYRAYSAAASAARAAYSAATAADSAADSALALIAIAHDAIRGD